MSLRAGAGLDGLQSACRTVVFGELDWSPGVHEQCIGRVARDGQKDPVAAYFLIAEMGSDPVIADVLGVKTAQIEGIRDPDAALVEQQIDPDKVKRLAEAFLEQRARKGEAA
jgi:SNF2 family DNA or RNA helicase